MASWPGGGGCWGGFKQEGQDENAGRLHQRAVLKDNHTGKQMGENKMQNFLLSKLLRWTGRKLDGYKTTIGGVGLILTGLAGLLGYVFPDQEGLPKMDVETVLTTVSAGFVALGFGGKAEKLKIEMTTKEQTS